MLVGVKQVSAFGELHRLTGQNVFHYLAGKMCQTDRTVIGGWWPILLSSEVSKRIVKGRARMSASSHSTRGLISIDAGALLLVHTFNIYRYIFHHWLNGLAVAIKSSAMVLRCWVNCSLRIFTLSLAEVASPEWGHDWHGCRSFVLDISPKILYSSFFQDLTKTPTISPASKTPALPRKH